MFIVPSMNTFFTLHASEVAAQCIVIGPVCLFVGVFKHEQLKIFCPDKYHTRVMYWQCGVRVWGVCYHDNSKLRASILTKLGL